MKPTLGAARLLDRLSHKRCDTGFLEGLIKSDEAHFLVLADQKPVIVSNEARDVAAIRWFSRHELTSLGLPMADALFLGVDRDRGRGHFAIAISEHRARHAPGGMELLRPLVDLRSLASQGIMREEELSLLGKAKALAGWHENSRCCGHCGGTTNVKDGGWKRKCWACGYESFPRVDPVVIMLVTDGQRCVLAHEARYAEKMFSALAGFVEPGEDLEHAVEREVREEVGITVDDVRFHSTQPWPFPHSLMIGCLATATPQELRADPKEVEAARWFDRDEVRRMLEKRHAEGLWLPGRQAIAHALITAWLDGKA